MRRGCEEETAQRGVQGADCDGGAIRREDPGLTVVGVRHPSDDDQHLEAGADEASERVVCAWLAALQLASADVVEIRRVTG